ncbi:MAG: L-threonylcarbamoyladenylate synthase, partial [Thermodesulfobacteriota bacterium]
GHPFVKRLFESLSGPITSTSANLSGMGNVYDFKSVFETFNGKVELIVDSGTLQPSKGSTIVDLTVTPPSILREGDISRELLEEFF